MILFSQYLIFSGISRVFLSWSFSSPSSSSRLGMSTYGTFLELHPIFGFFIPITSFLRGLVFVASFRWLLNFTAFTMLAIGQGILQPAYKKACCYGKDFLTGDEHGGHCDNPNLHSPKGFFECDADGLSDDHKDLVFWSYLLIGVSITAQIINILLIDFDIIARIQKVVQDTIDRKLITSDGPGVTVNVALILDMMGVPKAYMDKALKGKLKGLILRHKPLPLHYHVHWAHTGLYRLISIDPIFGMILSAQDFIGYSEVGVSLSYNICKSSCCF